MRYCKDDTLTAEAIEFVRANLLLQGFDCEAIGCRGVRVAVGGERPFVPVSAWFDEVRVDNNPRRVYRRNAGAINWARVARSVLEVAKVDAVRLEERRADLAESDAADAKVELAETLAGDMPEQVRLTNYLGSVDLKIRATKLHPEAIARIMRAAAAEFALAAAEAAIARIMPAEAVAE